MSELQKIRKQKEKLLAQLDTLKTEEQRCLSRKLIQCGYCKKKTQINKLIYLQHYWYTKPYGCTGGDYWSQGEGGFICFKCNEHNRSYWLPEIKELKYNFKRVCDVYDDYGLSGNSTEYKNKILIQKNKVVDNWKEILR